MTLGSLSVSAALVGAGLFVAAYVVHTIGWYRKPFHSLDDLLTALPETGAKVGLVQGAIGVSYAAAVGVPQAVYAQFPGEVTPAVLYLTWAASAGLFGAAILFLAQGFGLAYVAGRVRREPAEREVWSRIAHLIQLGWAGAAARALFHILIGLWTLRIAFAFFGTTPVLGILGLFVGAVSLLGGGAAWVRGFGKSDVRYQGVGLVAVATLLWLVALSIWVLI